MPIIGQLELLRATDLLNVRLRPAGFHSAVMEGVFVLDPDDDTLEFRALPAPTRGNGG